MHRFRAHPILLRTISCNITTPETSKFLEFRRKTCKRRPSPQPNLTWTQGRSPRLQTRIADEYLCNYLLPPSPVPPPPKETDVMQQRTFSRISSGLRSTPSAIIRRLCLARQSTYSSTPEGQCASGPKHYSLNDIWHINPSPWALTVHSTCYPLLTPAISPRLP